MLDKLDSSLRFNQEALNLRARRQEMIASNIAHADTPGYKARDLDFNSALSKAVERTRSGGTLSLSGTSAGHLAGSTTSGSDDPDLLFRTPAQSSIDGNTVEMDVERVNFADNAMRYEMNLTLLSARIKGMLAAIQQ
ncbi:MAG: flagellar basal body rod protein FlgB [Rhodoferax sp.]|nr:flagellar basal body rod protein FlgB [Rhodoferax sp.]